MEVNEFKYDYSEQKEFYFGLFSDTHLFSQRFDKARFAQDFDEAKSLGADIFVNGDIMDMIVHSDTKRSSGKGPKYDDDDEPVDAEVDYQVKKGAEAFTPYVEQLRLMGIGNHGIEIVRRHGTDPVRSLVHELNHRRKRDGKIRLGGYSGFIRLKFHHGRNGGVRTFDIYYCHGQGVSAEVTKGMIGLARRSYVCADLVWLGHNHTRLFGELDKEIGLNHLGRPYAREKRGLITGTYLKDFRLYDIEKTGYQMDYSEERTRVTHANGGALMRVRVNGKQQLEVKFLV